MLPVSSKQLIKDFLIESCQLLTWGQEVQLSAEKWKACCLKCSVMPNQPSRGNKCPISSLQTDETEGLQYSIRGLRKAEK